MSVPPALHAYCTLFFSGCQRSEVFRYLSIAVFLLKRAVMMPFLAGMSADPCSYSSIPYRTTHADSRAGVPTGDVRGLDFRCLRITCFVFTDISLADGSPTATIGNSGTTFTGNFDGQGHAISDFTMNKWFGSYIGFFGYIDSGA